MAAENRGPELTAVLGLFLGLAWLFVALRIYVKAFISKSWTVDDFLLIVSLIFFSTYASCSLSGVKYGTGRHVQDIPPEDIPTALYYWFLCELFYTITTVFIRLSIAVFLLRIAVKKHHRAIIYGTLGTVITFSIFYLFLVLFQCHPIRFFWDQYRGEKGACIDPAAVPDASIAHSAVSFTADWILGLLPILLIYDLQMNFRTKASIAGVLSLGLLAGIATVIRIPFIKVLALTNDFLFATTDVAIWSTVEPGLGIVAAAACALRPLFRTFYSLTTRNKSSGHITASKHSKIRSGRLPPSNNQQIPMRRVPTYKSSIASSGDSEEIQLRNNMMGGSGKITSAKSPFSDEHEGGDSRGNVGGIQVLQTIEISRHERDSISSAGSGNVPNTPWPGPGPATSDKDMV